MAPDSDYMFSRMKQYCAYQERCVNDIQTKLISWSVRHDIIDDVIHRLMEDDYLNEERFAKTFAGGKLRINKWGKNKIFAELSKRKIPELYIQIALQDIPDEEYLGILKEILTKKDNTLDVKDPFKRKQKLLDYAISKGFHPQVVRKVIEEIYD